MPYTDFHYTPTGTGVISGKEVLEQTEDAINDLGGQISGDVQTAIDTANNALNTANTASADAQNAVNTANTAYTTATNAQNTANAAQNTASNALTAAQTAQNDVNALGNRVTTAEGNITQNTNAITGLTTRMGTAEGNITTLQNDVITAQGTATSAQNTATMARQQAYVLRYSSSAITDNSTIAYSTLDNTDNIKVSDKIIDSDGKIFRVVSIDSANETVTVGSALIDLAQDSDVVHKSGDETINGNKTFLNSPIIYNPDTSVNDYLVLKNPKVTIGSTTDTGSQRVVFQDKNGTPIGSFISSIDSSGWTYTVLEGSSLDSQSNVITRSVRLRVTNTGASLLPSNDNNLLLGSASARWSNIYSVNYYYGPNNVEFSTKFVTTDTNQTVGGDKTFTNNVKVKNTNVTRGSTTGSGYKAVTYTDSNDDELSSISANKISNGSTSLSFKVSTTDTTDTVISSSVQFFITKNGNKVINPTTSDEIALGRSSNRWSDVVTAKVNGLEPSSLSLPSKTYVDISSYFTNTGTGEFNTYTAPSNGWIFLRLGSISSCQAQVLDSSDNILWGTSSSGAVEMITIPILSGCKLQTQWATGSAVTVATAIFYPCQGNV